MKPINVGLLGIGTVGGGTFTVLSRNQGEIARRAGRDILIRTIADKDVEKARGIANGAAQVTTMPSPWCATRKSTSWSS